MTLAKREYQPKPLWGEQEYAPAFTVWPVVETARTALADRREYAARGARSAA